MLAIKTRERSSISDMASLGVAWISYKLVGLRKPSDIPVSTNKLPSSRDRMLVKFEAVVGLICANPSIYSNSIVFTGFTGRTSSSQYGHKYTQDYIWLP